MALPLKFEKTELNFAKPQFICQQRITSVALAFSVGDITEGKFTPKRSQFDSIYPQAELAYFKFHGLQTTG